MVETLWELKIDNIKNKILIFFWWLLRLEKCGWIFIEKGNFLQVFFLGKLTFSLLYKSSLGNVQFICKMVVERKTIPIRGSHKIRIIGRNICRQTSTLHLGH